MSDLIHNGQPWIREAIAGQEEHIKRTRSCTGQLGLPHRFVDAGTWRECERCGVTETTADYEQKNGRDA